MSKEKILSSGVLNDFGLDIFPTFTLISVANLDPDHSSIVKVEVLDWTSGSPVALTVSPEAIVTVASNTTTFFTAVLGEAVFAYEVRITMNTKEDVVIQAVGVDQTFNNLEGFTLFHNDFKETQLD